MTQTPTIQDAMSTDVAGLTLARVNLMRARYLFMGLGLVIVKWPHLPHASDLPLYEGVELCLLTAMSLLAFLGLRYPVKLLPVLLFESAWKLLWLGLVAAPRAVSGDLDSASARSRPTAVWSWSSSPSSRGATPGSSTFAPTATRGGADQSGEPLGADHHPAHIIRGGALTTAVPRFVDIARHRPGPTRSPT